jgi:four helix bundle protein
MHNFTKLAVWSRARALGRDVYRLCSTVKSPEQKVVTAQLRRSALSISANIAEGCGKRSRAEGIRFLEIAAGSAAETEHHLLMATDLDILPKSACTRLGNEAEQIGRMLRALIKNFPESDDATREQEVLRT